MPEREENPQVRFVGPPPRRSTGRGGGRGQARPWGFHYQVAEQLMARPGEWAVIDTYESQGTASGVAHQIRRSEYGAYQPPGAWEAVSRLVQGEYRVYARYCPPGTTTEPESEATCSP